MLFRTGCQEGPRALAACAPSPTYGVDVGSADGAGEFALRLGGLLRRPINGSCNVMSPTTGGGRLQDGRVRQQEAWRQAAALTEQQWERACKGRGVAAGAVLLNSPPTLQNTRSKTGPLISESGCEHPLEGHTPAAACSAVSCQGCRPPLHLCTASSAARSCLVGPGRVFHLRAARRAFHVRGDGVCRLLPAHQHCLGLLTAWRERGSWLSPALSWQERRFSRPFLQTRGIATVEEMQVLSCLFNKALWCYSEARHRRSVWISLWSG